MIRASYSFLNMWQQGKVKEALLSYFHVPQPTPPNYVNGKKWDQYATRYINANKKLPPEWGGDLLKHPSTQYRLVVPYNELCELVTVWDVRDGDTIWELKSGATSARSYSNTAQVPLYLLACKMAQIPLEKAIISRYNPKTDSQDRAVLYPTISVLARGMNFLDSLVPEIHQYFEDNDLLGKTDKDMAIVLQNM